MSFTPFCTITFLSAFNSNAVGPGHQSLLISGGEKLRSDFGAPIGIKTDFWFIDVSSNPGTGGGTRWHEIVDIVPADEGNDNVATRDVADESSPEHPRTGAFPFTDGDGQREGEVLAMERLFRRRAHKMVHINGCDEMIIAGGELSSDDGTSYECSRDIIALRFRASTANSKGVSIAYRYLGQLPGACRVEFSLTVVNDRTLLYFGGRIHESATNSTQRYSSIEMAGGDVSNEMWRMDVFVLEVDGSSTSTSTNTNTSHDHDHAHVRQGVLPEVDPALDPAWARRTRVAFEGDWKSIGSAEDRSRARAWPSGRDMHRVVYSSREKKMFVFGGRDSLLYPLDDLWAFDLVSSMWTMMHPPVTLSRPRARYMHSLNIWKGEKMDHLVLFGGQQNDAWLTISKKAHEHGQLAPPPNTFSMTNDVWVYSPALNRWHLANMGGCAEGENGLVIQHGINNAYLYLLMGMGVAWLAGVHLYQRCFKAEQQGYEEIKSDDENNE